ncbi:MAG: hypothetical protein ABI158_13025 [Edaphobacter sp.]
MVFADGWDEAALIFKYIVPGGHAIWAGVSVAAVALSIREKYAIPSDLSM